MYAYACLHIFKNSLQLFELGPSWMFHNGKTDLVFLYADATESAPVIGDTSRNTLYVKFTL